jgi:hypothetical protein
VWLRRLALVALVVWAGVAVVRLTRLVEPPETPPGQEAAAMLPFLRGTIPSQAGYLYVEPGEFGTDSGTGIRLRYELYPRVYDDTRASVDESSVRDLMRRQNLQYVVVVDASQYPADHWLRQPRDWLRRVELDPNRYVLEAI